jgi:ABC-type Fe3+ transport system permease subunit
MQSVAQIAATVLAFIVIQALLIKYRRYRQKSEVGREWVSYKARLPQWLKFAELLIALVLWLCMSLGLFFLVLEYHSATHSGDLSKAALGIVVLASLFFALGPGFLLANVVIWLIPVMRRENLRAFGSSTLSFGAANAGLLKLTAVMAPIALAVMLLATMLP